VLWGKGWGLRGLHRRLAAAWWRRKARGWREGRRLRLVAWAWRWRRGWLRLGGGRLQGGRWLGECRLAGRLPAASWSRRGVAAVRRAAVAAQHAAVLAVAGVEQCQLRCGEHHSSVAVTEVSQQLVVLAHAGCAPTNGARTPAHG
jgi:hypothetical protein